jgi:hypothetical protein
MVHLGVRMDAEEDKADEVGADSLVSSPSWPLRHWDLPCACHLSSLPFHKEALYSLLLSHACQKAAELFPHDL